MALIPLIDCYELLDIDPKTLRASLKQAGIALSPHPTDARIKCLTTEQVEFVAALHSRSLHPLPAEPQTRSQEADTHLLHGRLTSLGITSAQGSLDLPLDPALVQKLTSLETRVTQLPDHLAELALLLLRGREHALDRRISTLEGIVAELAGKPVSLLPSAQRSLTQETDGSPQPKSTQKLRPAEQVARSRIPH